MTTTAPRTTPTGRLGNGELRRQVAAWLDEHPGPHTPGMIAKALERSAGAGAWADAGYTIFADDLEQAGDRLVRRPCSGHAGRWRSVPPRDGSPESCGEPSSGPGSVIVSRASA